MKKKWLVFALVLVMVMSACSKEKSNEKASDSVTIGYFPNLTHITTMVALEKGYFAEAFGENVSLDTKVVSNGGLFMEAMVTKAIDIGTVGPGPMLNTYVKDPRYHIVSGAVNGGAVLVTADYANISKLEDLDGKKVAIPVIGSTQDVMLRKALAEVGLKPTSNGGTVELFAAAPADTATLFVQESVEAAATQEPWGYILETQAKGKTLLDWESFAWGKDSTNTIVAASDHFIENPDLVVAYLKAHVQAVQFIEEHPEESKQLVIDHLKELTGKELSADEVAAAFDHLHVTTEVNEEVLQEMADISLEAQYVPTSDIDGLVDLTYLEKAKIK